MVLITIIAHGAALWAERRPLAPHGLFDSPYWNNELSVEFWLMAALLVVAVRASRSPAGGAERPAVT